MSGVFNSVWTCRIDSQFQTCTPFDLTPFIRVMPAASSGASSPLSAASTASLRTAGMRTLIEIEPSPRASNATREAPTVALVKPGRGSWPYQRKILLAGHGHSAAHAILQFAALLAEAPETQVVWATRSLNQRPCVEVSSDPLPERQRVVSKANQLAARPPWWLTVERRAAVEAIREEEGGKLRVALLGGRAVLVDEIVGLTGYRPDLSFLSELAIDIAPATEGAARLTRALSNVTDCLSIPSAAPADLDSGEPGFHFAGAKSYGRARTFFLKSGYAQPETILNRLEST
jgi:hypothetical protein